MGKKGDVLNVLSKKYSYEMMNALREGPKRFKDLSRACNSEKMRAERLRELEDLDLLDISLERAGRRAVSVYSLSDVGKATLKLAEDIRRLQKGS